MGISLLAGWTKKEGGHLRLKKILMLSNRTA